MTTEFILHYISKAERDIKWCENLNISGVMDKEIENYKSFIEYLRQHPNYRKPIPVDTPPSHIA